MHTREKTANMPRFSFPKSARKDMFRKVVYAQIVTQKKKSIQLPEP